MRWYRCKQHGKAFPHFTEAIRFCPSRATYHANRASTALKLGRSDIALADARCSCLRWGSISYSNFCCVQQSDMIKLMPSALNRTPRLFLYRAALKLDPGYLKAHLREASALLDLQRPVEALEAYQRALLLCPTSTAAQVG